MSSFKFEAWPTEFRSINQYFGANPQNYAQFGLPGHEGLDIMAPSGSRIFAVASGRIKVVNTQPTSHNYGIHIRVEHADGYETIYAHLKEARVSPGQQVQAGDLLGLADNTGNSFGSHLHLTLKKKGAKLGNWPINIIDPTPFLMPLMDFQTPAGPYTDGWAYTDAIFVVDDLAQASSGGINLREQPRVNGRLIDLVPGGTIMIVTGAKRGLYTQVKVATSAFSNAKPPEPLPPDPPPPPTVTTVDGWAYSRYLTRVGDQAVVGQYGINLRMSPARSGKNIGLVKGGSTLSILGAVSGEYTPVRARRTDFMGPVSLPESPPVIFPGDAAPPSDTYLGWAWSPYLTIIGTQAMVGRFGINLRNRPTRASQNIGLVKGSAAATVVGKSKGEYTPILAHRADVLNIPNTIPTIEQPDSIPGDTSPPPPPEEPIHDTTPGWAFSTQVTVTGETAVAGPYGINLRNAPRRSAQNIGFIPANARMIVTGPAQGEYTPVRVDDEILNPVFGTAPITDTTTPPETPNPDPTPFGNAKIGIHASADPAISQAEIDEIGVMRPGIIKLLSFHDPHAISKLVAVQPNASWIVRAFLDFGGRTISPNQFFNDTISDMKRTLNLLQGKDVVVELHNETNLRQEGLGSSWSDGASFAQWWLEVLQQYRQELPGQRFLYPGLSPGSDVGNLKQDHIRFIEASREAVEAADGLGVHLYWSNVYPLTRALDVLDDAISRFRFKPIWVTEASNNKAGTSTFRKGMEYLKFWRELQKRPTVQGVTYFVASASNPDFKEEIWVGRKIAPVIGRR